MTAEQVARITEEPHQLQLKYIVIHLLTPAVLEALIRVPSLTRLTPSSLVTTDITPLHRLVHLTELDLPTLREAAPIDSYAALMRWCSKIESLALKHPHLTSAHLSAIFAALPHLHRLRLTSCPSLVSLACFSSGSITESLSSLCLIDCAALPSSELVQLHALQRLEVSVCCIRSPRPSVTSSSRASRKSVHPRSEPSRAWRSSPTDDDARGM